MASKRVKEVAKSKAKSQGTAGIRGGEFDGSTDIAMYDIGLGGFDGSIHRDRINEIQLNAPSLRLGFTFLLRSPGMGRTFARLLFTFVERVCSASRPGSCLRETVWFWV